MAEVPFLSRLPTHEHRLPNGLTVLIREDHSAPVVAIITHVKAGYFNEPDALVGISHVLEHMFFKGTRRRGAGEIARETRAAGGYLNAGTIYDYTSYHTVLPAASLEMGLDIQADALRHSQIDEEELRKELLVIIQEAKRKLDNPGAVAVESLYEEMFDVHRIRRWRIGTEEGLSRLGRAEVWEYYRRLYHPANIVLAVAGDVDPARTLALVERHYGDMESGEAVGERSPEEPARRGFRFREMSGDIAQGHMEWGWRTPPALHADTPRLDLLASILGQGRASRLYRQVRERGLVTGITAYNYTPTEVGVFGVSAELLPRDAESAFAAVWRAIAAVCEDAPAESELERARNVLEARLLRRMETVEGQANLLVEWQALGDWRMAEQYLGQVLATTPDQLRDVAQRYLRLDDATALLYRPAGATPLGWDARAARDAIRRGARTPAPAPPTAPVATARARAASPPPRPSEDHGVLVYELPGLTVAVKVRPSAPLVSMEVCFRDGAVMESLQDAGITSLTARTSIKGTAARTGAALAEATESLGGSVIPTVSADLFSWGLSLPSRHFDLGFSLLAEVVREPRFPSDEVERERKVALSDLEHLRDDMYRYPFRLFLQGAFGGHPYGFSATETEAAIRVLDRDRIAAWHQRHVLGAKPLVVVAGDIDGDTVAGVVAREFGGVFAGERRNGARPAPWPAAPLEVADRRGKTQTAIMLGYPGVRRADPAVYPLQVLSHVVSGLGGRLFEELRSRRSLAYTVSAFPVARRLGGAFVSYIATSPDQEEAARRGLLAELDRITQEPVGEDELARAQRYAVGAWQIRGQANAAHVTDIAQALLLGSGVEELARYEERIRAVTPAMIRDTAARLFEPHRVIEGIVRGSGGGR
jgi:zinc protease